jgi:predicted amidohydrolase YtcJ
LKADLILRNVRLIRNQLVDVAITGGYISHMGKQLSVSGAKIDGKGLRLLPGLIDHHIHLLATAAKLASVDLQGSNSADEIAQHLGNARPDSAGWIRAIGYDETAAGLLDRALLDQWVPTYPVRVQDRTGALWMLNSRAIERLGSGPFPPCVERTVTGAPTGRVWRGDAWLGETIGQTPPPLAQLGKALARFGVTGVTDAGARNGPVEAALLSGALPQRLMLMGSEDLPRSSQYTRGPLKLLYDERDLPDLDAIAACIKNARADGRTVAAHCVTLAELLFFFAALDAAGGTHLGDRIEHGSVIPASFIPDIASRRLTVVTQPGFVATRGDRYLAQTPAHERPDLYRLRSLLTAGVPLAAGSDAPYGDANPWIGIRAAQDRKTASHKILGPAERLERDQAISLSMGSFEHPGGPPRQVKIGAPADLILVRADPIEPVCLTMIGGTILHLAIE